MARQVIDREALLKIVNKHMEELVECRNIHFSSVVADPHRTHGGNWTFGGYQLSGGDHDQVECDEKIRSFLRDLQSRYDIR